MRYVRGFVGFFPSPPGIQPGGLVPSLEEKQTGGYNLSGLYKSWFHDLKISKVHNLNIKEGDVRLMKANLRLSLKHQAVFYLLSVETDSDLNHRKHLL